MGNSTRGCCRLWVPAVPCALTSTWGCHDLPRRLSAVCQVHILQVPSRSYDPPCMYCWWWYRGLKHLCPWCRVALNRREPAPEGLHPKLTGHTESERGKEGERTGYGHRITCYQNVRPKLMCSAGCAVVISLQSGFFPSDTM